MGHQNRFTTPIVLLVMAHALPVITYLGLSEAALGKIATHLMSSSEYVEWMVMLLFFYLPLSLAFSQQALVAIWFFYSRRHIAWRLIGLAATTTILTFYLRPLVDETSSAVILQAVVTGAIVGLLFVLRLLRVFVVYYERFHRATSVVVASAQFSLRQLLLGSVFVAFSLGCFSALGGMQSVREDPLAPLVMGFLVAGEAVAALWLALGVGWLLLRGLVFLACTALPTVSLTGLLIFQDAGINGEELAWALFMITIPGVISLICLVSLLVVRRCGYRLVRVRGGNAASRSDGDAVATNFGGAL